MRQNFWLNVSLKFPQKKFPKSKEFGNGEGVCLDSYLIPLCPWQCEKRFSRYIETSHSVSHCNEEKRYDSADLTNTASDAYIYVSLWIIDLQDKYVKKNYITTFLSNCEFPVMINIIQYVQLPSVHDAERQGARVFHTP